MYVCDVPYAQRIWKSSEHAYQASKTLDPDEQAAIFNEEYPKRTKQMGKLVTLRDDWCAETKLAIMEEVVRSKFTHNEDLKLQLLLTHPRILIEGNTWKDNFWGRCPPDQTSGQNHLGRILMKIRMELFVQDSVEF